MNCTGHFWYCYTDFESTKLLVLGFNKYFNILTLIRVGLFCGGARSAGSKSQHSFFITQMFFNVRKKRSLVVPNFWWRTPMVKAHQPCFRSQLILYNVSVPPATGICSDPCSVIVNLAAAINLEGSWSRFNISSSGISVTLWKEKYVNIEC